MKNPVVAFFGGIVLVTLVTVPAAAEVKIQAYVTPTGRIVFTNVVDTPVPVNLVQSATVSSDPVHLLIDSIAGNHGVDPALVKAIVKTESNFNRWAISSKGALGLMQLIPNTGARYGVRDFFDPRQNIEAGVRHIKFLLEKFNGNLDLSLAAYNAGENLVEKLGRIPSIPETRDYVRKVRASYGKTPASATTATKAAPVAAVAEVVKPEPPQIFRSVDERGVVHYSNIAPPQ